MIALESALSHRMMDYETLENVLEPHGFVLGGNWEYTHGSFDCALDGEKQTVWLRIPFEVVQGELDPNSPAPGTRVIIGTPYVLRHVYNDGNDPNAPFTTAGALINQFQEPADPDAPADERDVRKAREVLREVEAAVAAIG